MLERTLLYPKALQGTGTGQVQSLRSYLEHLALAHNMKPKGLLELLFREHPCEGMESPVPTLLKRCNLHGNSLLGPVVRERLERATGSVLTQATLSRVSRLLAASNLTRDEVMYCPCCVQQGEELPYIQLLWTVDCVQACPIHQVKLRSGTFCGALPSERLPVQKRPSLGGVCTQCGSVGHRCVSAAPEQAGLEEVAVAREVARILALPSETTATFTPESLIAGIKAVVDAVYGGQVVRASREAGLSRASVHTWVNGGRPGLPWLLQLCLHSGADVVELLAGRYVLSADQSLTNRRLDVAGRSYTVANLDDADIRRLLLEAAKEVEPPSLREFARQHGMHIDTPKHRFRKEATVLADARREYLTKFWREQFETALTAYEKAAAELIVKRKSVTTNHLQKVSGLVAFSQNAPRVRALKHVLASTSVSGPAHAGAVT